MAPIQVLHWVWQAATTEPLVTPLSVFVGSRLAIFALVLFFVGLFPIAPDQKPSFLQAFSTWDGGWYLGIATNGYSWQGPGVQSNVAFFPLYPLLGKMVGFLLGSPQWGLFVVANVSFAFYLVYLYKLAWLDFDRDAAYRAILYVAIFPLSFIFSCLYTESTMLALATASFYYARRGKWRVAVLLALLTTLTRLVGVAVLLPLAWELFKQNGLARKGALLLVIPMGTVGFALYLWRLAGTPVVFLVTEQAWDRSLIWPWQMIQIGFQITTHNPLANYVTSIAIVDFATMLMCIMLAVWAVRRLSPSYWLYAWPVILVPLSSVVDPSKGLPTASVARYMMAAFPCFILLGLAGKNRYVHHILTFTFAVLLGVLSMYFFCGIWVG